MSTAISSLAHGAKYPYDGRKPKDAAHRATLGVLANLLDRKGMRQELDQVDREVRAEIVDELSSIIRQAGLTST